MKGISTMIAAVLLIAFTVSVGAIISLWLTGLTRTTTAGAETGAAATIECANSGFEIISVSSSNIYVTMSSGNVDIYMRNIRASDGSVISTSGKLSSPGTTLSLSWTRGTNTSVTVIGLCEYGATNTSVEATCRSVEDCWAI